MANIKQQRKRVKIARRERLENLRYKSRIKTMFKSLSVAVGEDKEKAQRLGLELISLIDKAASRGVLHANNAARKKSRVTAMVKLPEGIGKPPGPATKEPRNGKSKAQRRVERSQAKRAKKADTKEKQAAKTAAAKTEPAPAEPAKETKEAEPEPAPAKAAEEETTNTDQAEKKETEAS